MKKEGDFSAGSLILIILIIVLISACVYVFYNIFSDVYSNPVFLKPSKIEVKNTSYSDLQFFPNMRFPDKTIGYMIGSECDETKRANMHLAFEFIQNRTPIVFYSSATPDIQVRCSEEYKKGDLFVAGEGGPSNFINTSLFSIITKGEIVLLSDSCSYNVELHELLHVLGFNHSLSQNDIMYTISACGQFVSQNMINELNRLYSIPSLPDLYFGEVNAVKKGGYVNLNFSVINQGLKESKGFYFTLYSDNKQDYSSGIGNLDAGAGKMISVENVRVPSGTREIKLVINGSEELDYSNNEAVLDVPS